MKFLKNIIVVISLAICGLISIFNLIYLPTVSNGWEEKVTYSHISIIGYLIILFVIIGIVSISNFFEEKNRIDKKKKTLITVGVFLIYFIISIAWVLYRNSYPIADSLRVYEAACQIFERKTIENFKYFELYPQNLGLAYVFSKVFRIFNSKNVIIIKIINVIANCLSIFGLYKILERLEKDYKVNKMLFAILAFTYIPIIFLVNFTYGDLLGMPFVIFSIYFCMKYIETDKLYNLIISSLLMMSSVFIRMNNLIFVIAVLIYLVLSLNIKKKEVDKKIYIKQLSIKLLGIIMFAIISIFPSSCIKNMLINRYAINGENSYPVIGFIAMGMEEGERANGWYKEKTASYSWNEIETADENYKNIIKERLNYFKNNIFYTIKFYSKKTISMWAEPLQEAIWQNLSFNFASDFLNEQSEEEALKTKEKDAHLVYMESAIAIYQKTLLIIIFSSTTIFILKYRKNISNEVVLLVLCFIGGVLFHTMWEGKSRYIIPYIVILIPVASMKLKISKFKNQNYLEGMKN